MYVNTCKQMCLYKQVEKFGRIYTTRVEVGMEGQRQKNSSLPFERAVVRTGLNEAGTCELWV